MAILSCSFKCTKDSVITVGKITRVYKGYVDLIAYINGEKYSVKQSAYFNPDRVGKYYLICINKKNKYCINLVKHEGKNIELSGSFLQNFLLENNLLDKNFDEEGEYKSIFSGQAIGCWILNMINMSNSDSLCGCAGDVISYPEIDWTQ